MAVKERGILMHARSILGILDGRKTQTRRIAKIPEYVVGAEAPQRRRGEPPKHQRPYFDAYNGGPFWCWWDEFGRQGDGIKCPYGKPGDRLWVRETFGVFAVDGCSVGIGYRADHPENGDLSKTDGGYNFRYLESIEEVEAAEKLVNGERWRSSIHIPRWVSRLTLEIINIRVERVQDISEEDCRAEGVRELRDGSGVFAGRKGPGKLVTPWITAKEAFAELWDDTNGKGAWDRNDWVWVIGFRRMT